MKQFFYLVTLLLLLPHNGLAASKTPHDDAEIRCLDCHIKLPLERVALSFYSDIPSICLTCHKHYPCKDDTDTNNGNIHPLNMTPSMTIPNDLVLNNKGQTSCITCHFYHDKGKEALTSHSHYLRRSTVKRLCMSCHKKI
jgi:hypothetical protein